MKTTLILNREYKKLTAKNILGDFGYVQFCYCTFGCTIKSQILKVTSNSAGAVIKLPRNSEASVSNDAKIPGFCFCEFSFSFKCYKV